MSRILSSLTIISTLIISSTVQAVTTEEFVQFNEEYTQDYFNYLLFKKNSLNTAAELKKRSSNHKSIKRNLAAVTEYINVQSLKNNNLLKEILLGIEK